MYHMSFCFGKADGNINFRGRTLIGSLCTSRHISITQSRGLWFDLVLHMHYVSWAWQLAISRPMMGRTAHARLQKEAVFCIAAVLCTPNSIALHRDMATRQMHAIFRQSQRQERMGMPEFISQRAM